MSSRRSQAKFEQRAAWLLCYLWHLDVFPSNKHRLGSDKLTKSAWSCVALLVGGLPYTFSLFIRSLSVCVCIPAAPGRPQPGFHCSMTAPICSTFSHLRVCVLLVGGLHQICTTLSSFPLWESHLWSDLRRNNSDTDCKTGDIQRPFSCAEVNKRGKELWSI